MADEQKRDWVVIVDAISKLLIPVVIAVGGILYSWHQAKVDANRLDTEKRREEDRQNLERDTGYVKMLLSNDPNEKTLAIDIIRVMSRQDKFSPDLLAVLTIMAGDDKNLPLAESAKRILANQQEVTSSKASDSAGNVYIQISEPEQRDDAKALQDALNKAGFVVPGIELVTGNVATLHTYVRFFSASDEPRAHQVRDVMSHLRYASPDVQNFSNFTSSSLSPIEIWIGKNQGKLPQSPGT